MDEIAATIKRRDKVSNGTAWFATAIGLLMIAAAAAEAYAAWRLMKYIMRLNFFRAIDVMAAPSKDQAQLLAQVGISEATVHVWVGIAWVATGLLALAGLWMLVRRRFAWRIGWVAAIAMIVAAGCTVVGGQVLIRYAGFPPLAWRIYALGFAIGSAPGWALMAVWLIDRLFLHPVGSRAWRIARIRRSRRQSDPSAC